MRRQLKNALHDIIEYRRQVWSADGLTFVETRSLYDLDRERMRSAVRGWFDGHPGVHWARLNESFGRVVISHEPGVAPRELVARVAALEKELGLGRRAFAKDPAPFPGDDRPMTRAAIETVADAGGLFAAGVLRLARVEVLPAEIDFEALISVMRNVPALRQALDDRVGQAASDLGLALAAAASGALLQGSVGLVTDGVHRMLRLREGRARQAVWTDHAPRFAGRPEQHEHTRARPERPRPLPPGPIETYVETAVPASLGGFGAGLASSNRLEGAIAMIFGGMPKPAKQGRAAWSAELGRRLARRGIVVLDPAALRRLDRVDTVVVDVDSLTPRAGEMIDVVPMGDHPTAPLRARADALFVATDPYRHAEHGGWTLAPLSRLPVSVDRGTASPIRAGAGPGGRLLGLLEGDELRAIVPIRPEVDPHAEALVEAARRAELRLVVVDDEPNRVGWAEVDAVLPGSVGQIVAGEQTRDHGVLYIGTDPSALAAADIGVGIVDQADRRAQWEAHILIEAPLSNACSLVDATRLARDAARQSVAISEVVALAGLVLAVDGLGIKAARRILNISNLATLGAMLNGVRIAQKVELHRTVRRRDHTPWHALDIGVVIERLRSSATGLTHGAARERVTSQEPPPSDWTVFQSILVEELANPLSPVLATGAALSALVGSAADAAMVASVLGLNSVVGAVQRYRAEQSIAELAREERRPVKVARSGATVEIDISELVPGDVIELVAGEVVPADCRLIVADELELDESALTGESFLVRKQAEASFGLAIADRASMIWAGTTVGSGRARAVVVATGDDTVSRGTLHTPSRAERMEGGVEARLEQIMAWTTPVAVGAGAAILLSGLLRRRRPRDLVGAAVSLAIAAVPEGLPILATLAQLAAANRLAQQGALVRNHRAVEALGRIDVLCADKTGTLTFGQMRLAGVSDGTTHQELDTLDGHHRSILGDALRASPVPVDGEVLPHQTDRALWDGAQRAGVDLHEGLDGWTRVHELPFEPGRAYHAVLGDEGGRLRMTVKGSPEVLIPRCNRIKGPDGENRTLLPEERQELLDETVRLAGRGYRTLVVVERGAREGSRVTDARVRQLVFRGIIVFEDPLRPTASAAVERLGRAGVRVVMITGDHPATGARMAETLGLPTHRVVTGPELERADDATLQGLIEDVAVFARVTPDQKVRIVRAFQAAGRVVAMTGDGANDAPAIRLADVGIALGERATSAARQAADLVVLDERIDTLVDAVLEGRALWTSVRKAVSLLVGGNLGEIGFTLLAGLIDGRSPLNARQLMLVNLMTDALPALALALQRPFEDDPEALLRAGPEASLGAVLDREIAWRATVTSGAAAGAWVAARLTGGRERAGTVGMLTLVGCQLGQALVMGGHSREVVTTSVGSAAATLALVQIPGVSQFFGCRPVGPLALTQAVTASAVGTWVSAAGPRLARVAARLAEETGLIDEVRKTELTRLVTESRMLGPLFQRDRSSETRARPIR